MAADKDRSGGAGNAPSKRSARLQALFAKVINEMCRHVPVESNDLCISYVILHTPKCFKSKYLAECTQRRLLTVTYSAVVATKAAA